MHRFSILDTDRRSPIHSKQTLAQKLVDLGLAEDIKEGANFLPELLQIRASIVKGKIFLSSIGYCFRAVPERRFSSTPLYYALAHRIGD